MSRRRPLYDFLEDAPYDYPGIPRTREWRHSERAFDEQSIARSINPPRGRVYSYDGHLSASERERCRAYDEVHSSSPGAALRIAYQQNSRRPGAVSLQDRVDQDLRTPHRQLLSNARTSVIRRNPHPSPAPSIFSRIVARLSSAISSPRRRQELRECAICLQSLSPTTFPAITPTCTHVPSICKVCINTWLGTNGVLTAYTWYNIRCPSLDCGEVIQPADMYRFCTPELFDRYERFATHSAMAVEEERHEPAQDQSHRAQDQASTHYLARHTQPCPGEIRRGIRCGIAVEKIKGCSHMKCVLCKAEFCWVCLQPWRGGLHLDDCTGNDDDVPLAWREFGS